MAKLPLALRMSAIAVVAAAFSAGLAGGLYGAHAWLEADAPLADLDDEDALRARHGDRLAVHGRVVEHRIETSVRPGATTFAYFLVLDDGTAARAFPVPRPDYDRTPDGRWVVLDLRWAGEGFAPAPPEDAVQPWMWQGALVASAALLGAGAVSRVAERGLRIRRRGDVLEIDAASRGR